MNKLHRNLLLSDAVINLVVGFILVLFPFGTADIFGLPRTDTGFYPIILGAVLFGIGLALLIEYFGFRKQLRGLGLEGAIAINICGAAGLLVWLLFTSLTLPFKGVVTLWLVVVLVFGIAVVEIYSLLKNK